METEEIVKQSWTVKVAMTSNIIVILLKTEEIIQLLIKKGISYEHCIEKEELINLAIEVGLLSSDDLSRQFPHVLPFL
jgi:hypothetical protein